MKWFAFVLVLFCCSAMALAEIVELRNGQKIEAHIVRISESQLIVSRAGVEKAYPRADVLSVTFAQPETAAPASQAARDTLAALRGLRSVVKSGITYLQYSARVLDARVITDRFLESPRTGEFQARATASTAMEYYQIAGNLWNAHLTHDVSAAYRLGVELRDSVRVNQCALVKDPIAMLKYSGAYETQNRIEGAFMTMAEELRDASIACASERIDTLDRVLADPKP